MKSILADLYGGKLHPDEKIVPNEPEYNQLNREISDKLELCKERMSESDFMLLDDILNLYGQSHATHARASFIYGFRMGALLITEVFTGQAELMKDAL